MKRVFSSAFFLVVTIAACWTTGLSTLCLCQEISAQVPPLLAIPAQRLMIEQVDELIEAGEVDEALRLLEKLLDEADTRLIAISSQQTAATIKTQRYLPLAHWAAEKMANVLERFPDTASKIHARQNEPAKLALAQLQKTKDVRAAQLSLRRYAGTPLRRKFQLLLSDLYLECGWGIAASQALELSGQSLRIGADERATTPSTESANRPPNEHVATGSLSAHFVWQQLAAGRTTAVQERVWLEVFAPRWIASNSPPSSNVATAPATGATIPLASTNISESITRQIIAAAIDPQSLDAPAIRSWGLEVARHIEAAGGRELKTFLEQTANWSPRNENSEAVDSFHASFSKQQVTNRDTALRDAHRAYVTWPTWSHTLERFSARSDRPSVSGPRVAESQRATLPYFPVVYKGIVFVNELTHIAAYKLKTGEAWPSGSGGLPLFASEQSAASYLPLGYPMIGSPRGTLHISGDCLYARMGSPITGRLNPRVTSGSDTDTSLSYLVGLDLSKQGSMLPGFPLHLKATDFGGAESSGAEFDGPPLAWGDLLIVAVAQRDHVGLRRSLAAFDRFTGKLEWKSGVLASGTVAEAEHANLISHQQLTIAGGRIFYNTHLGSIACLDPLTGETQWLVQYSTPLENPAFPQPNRYRYREMTPCLLSAGLVYCTPQDTPEIFALDALTGELVWSTDDHCVADIVQLLGAPGDTLLASGDRLLWLDKRNGKVVASFPGNTTPIVGGALPSPRGLGRGFISGQYVYWPTAGEIYVFPTQLPPKLAGNSNINIPAIVRRIAVEPGGGDGVNVLIVDDTLLVASPSRLMAYRAD